MLSLVDIKKYLMQVKITTLNSLCTYFHAEPETMRCMLAHWVRKGCIRQCMKTPACGTQCFKCNVGYRKLGSSCIDVYILTSGLMVLSQRFLCHCRLCSRLLLRV